MIGVANNGNTIPPIPKTLNAIPVATILQYLFIVYALRKTFDATTSNIASKYLNL